MTNWTDYVKSFAKANNTTYGCALSDPACSAGYRKKFGNKKPLGKNKEKELMGMEDIDAKPSKKATDFKERKTAMKAKLNKSQVQKQLLETTGMMAEDINQFVPVQDLAGNFVVPEPVKKKRGRPSKKEAENITMEIKEIKKRGRPKKYATAEEARKAKIANTIAGAKRRKEAKGKGIKEIRQLKNRTGLENLQYRLSPDDVDLLLNNPPPTPHAEKTIKQLKKLLREQHNLGNYNNEIEPNKSIYEELTLRGEGLFSSFNKKIKGAVQAVATTADALGKKVKDTATAVKDTASAVIYGRNDYPPKVRNIISKYGDKNITGIMLGRTPLGTPLLTALQVASGNTFSQKLENTPYDTLFHLFMCIELDSRVRITLEKNEVINAENTCKLPKETETKNITSSDIPQGLTLNEALNKTKERMGGNYFTYSAKDNNCQDFIVAFLTANNIGNETDKSWVKQETKVLFEGNDRLRKIANTLTDIGARVDVLRQGAGNAQSGEAGTQPVGIITGLPVDIILEYLTDEDVIRLFGGLFNEGSAVNPNLIYTLGNRRFQLDDAQYARMRLRVANLRKRLQEAPKQTGRKRFDKGDGDGKGKDLFGVKSAKGISNNPIDQLNAFNTNAMLLGNQKRTKEQEDLRKLRGYGNKKSPVNNIGMANSWIEYVKAYAKKNNMKYNEALKDPACKAGYKKGEGVFDIVKSVGKAVAPALIDLASQEAKRRVGGGMPTSRDEYISQLYDQANLGANGRVKL